MIGSGPACEIRLQWDGVQALEATLEIGEESQVRLVVPGEDDVETELPLNISIGENELTFFRPEHTHGWCEPVAETDENQQIGISVGGSAPLPRTLQVKSPLLVGSFDSCDVVVPGVECPGVAVAIWLRGANRVLLQVLDNSVPVDWQNRGDVLEGEAELPLTVFVSGTPVNITLTPKRNASLAPTAVRLAQPPAAQGGADGELVRKKPSGLLVIGAGLAAMLLTALVIHFLFSTQNAVVKVPEPSTAQDVVTPSDASISDGVKNVVPATEVTGQLPTAPTTPSPMAAKVLAAETNAALHPSSPAPEQPKASPSVTTTTSVTQPQPVADVEQGPTTVAVLEFENSSKKEDMEPLRKGLRDMMMTDLSQVSSIKMVERGRLQDLLQEMKLAEGQFIDPATAAKLGKGLAATAVLTGSYLAIGDNIRIDARMGKVETGEVIMAEQVSGSQPDFFTLQKVLAEKMVERLEVNATPQEQLALRRPQTANFEAFSAYSRGVLALEKGEKGEARKELASAVQQDASFKLASIALDEVEKEAKKALGFLDLKAEELSKTVKERFDSQFSRYRALAEGPPQVSAEYLAAPVITAAHYGLRGSTQEEWKMLLAYSERLSSVFKRQGTGIYGEIRMILLREVSDLQSMARLTGGMGAFSAEGAELVPGSGGESITLSVPSFSFVPLGGSSPESPSRPWSLLQLLHTPAFGSSTNTRKLIEECIESPDEVEFPDCWSLAAVKAGLSDMSQTHRRAIRLERSLSMVRAAGLKVASQGPKSEITKFNAPAFLVLSGILQSYASADLTKYRNWSQDWHTFAQMAIDAAALTDQIPANELQNVIAALRYVAGASHDLTVQRDANQAILNIVETNK